jgi:peptidoglycan/xylan/chitin deacetylase (PgdA/CDA1 family)
MANTGSTRRRFLGATAGAIGALSASTGTSVASASGERAGSRPPIAPQQADVPATTGHVLLTFDHAAPSIYDTAFLILREFGYPALVAAVGDRIGPTRGSLLGLPQLKELQSTGWEIGSHSMSGHPDLTSLSNEEIETQCRNAKQWLLDNGFASEAASIAYPYESANERVAEVAREYFAIGFGGPYRHGTEIDDPLLVGRINGDDVEATREAIDAAAANGQVLAIMYHTVGADNDRIGASAFRETMAHVRSKNEDLQVITPSILAWLLTGEPTESAADRAANASAAERATTTRSPTETDTTPSRTDTTSSASPTDMADTTDTTDSLSTTAADTPSTTTTDTPTDSPSPTAADTATTRQNASTDTLTTVAPDTSTGTPEPTGTNTERTAADGPGFGVLATLAGLAGWSAYRLRTDDE